MKNSDDWGSREKNTTQDTPGNMSIERFDGGHIGSLRTLNSRELMLPNDVRGLGKSASYHPSLTPAAKSLRQLKVRYSKDESQVSTAAGGSKANERSGTIGGEGLLSPK